MKLTTIKRAALAGFAAALLAPAAQASIWTGDDGGAGSTTSGTATVDQAYVRALSIRGEALNAKYGPGRYFEALEIRSESLNRLHAIDAYVSALDVRSRALNEQYRLGSYFDALDVRSQALNEKYGLGSSYFKALDTRSRALNDQLGLGSVRPDDRAGVRAVDTTPTTVPTAGGFDWSDAGTGALAAFAITLIAATMLMTTAVVRERRRSIPAL